MVFLILRYLLNTWAGKILWSRKWQLAPVFLLGKFHGQGSLLGYSLMGSQRVRHDCVCAHTHARTCCHEVMGPDSLIAQMVKSLPAVLETQVQSLGREYPLEKEMATHSSILPWEIPWMEKSDRLQSMGLQSRTQLSDFTSLHFSGTGCHDHSFLNVEF